MRMTTIITKEPQAPKELIDHIIRPGLRDIKLDVIGYADGHRVYRFHNPRGEEYCEGTDSSDVVQFDGEKPSQWMQEMFEIDSSWPMREPLLKPLNWVTTSQPRHALFTDVSMMQVFQLAIVSRASAK